MSTQSEMIGRTVQVSNAFADAVNRWTGCDWPLTFGSNYLQLEDLTATQCQLMARATSGQEADAWWEAAVWLARVEHEASEAQKEAQQAVVAAQAGYWPAALSHARKACDIEARYHTHLVWRPLCDAIERTL